MTRATAQYDFASDNTSGAPPEVIEAILRANTGFAAAYGADPLTRQAADLIRRMVDADVPVYFVNSGTAANAISLATVCHSFESVLAHRHAHIITDEAGAPGFIGHGLGVSGLEGVHGKIEPAALAKALEAPHGSHRQTPGALSLTNATEFGTVYSSAHIGELTALAQASGLKVHLDGARLANAVAAGFDPKSIKNLGVDVLVIGGTKAGMFGSEAIVLFEKRTANRFDARLKQAGHLPSKSRFLGAPWIAMLEADTWVSRARHANAMAQRLARVMPWELAHPVETNCVFVRMDEQIHRSLAKLGLIVHRFADGTVRFMCSWATTPDSIHELAAVLDRLKSDTSAGPRAH